MKVVLGLSLIICILAAPVILLLFIIDGLN